MTVATKPRPTETAETPAAEEPSTSMSPRARAVIIAIAAVAVIVIAGAIIFGAMAPTNHPSTPAAGAAPSHSSATKPDTTGADDGEVGDTPMTKPRATSTLSIFLRKVATIGPKTKHVPSVLATVASGAIVAEIENSQAELKTDGWSQKGVPVVASVRILKSDPKSAKPTATVEACVDSSKVVVYDSKGKVIPMAGGKAAARALNIYSLQRTDGRWRVISRTFPNNPNC